MNDSNENFDAQFLDKINQSLYYDIWETDTELTDEQRQSLKSLLEDRYLSLYGRKKNKEVIHIGLDHPSSCEIDAQTLMFGPAGNLCDQPEIIITGISTSITAANGIARQLKSNDVDTISKQDLREIYLQNIYKGNMYTNFKDQWKKRSSDSIYESSFLDLFDMVEGKKKISGQSNIMLTQTTLHGIATFYDKRHDRYTWWPPSTKVFKNEASKLLFEDFFVDNVLIKRFFENPKAKYLFVMGNDAYNMLKRTFKKNDKLIHFNTKVQFIQDLGSDFKISDIATDVNTKYIIKVKHSAA